MIGIPPPDGMAGEFIASWYWTEVQRYARHHSRIEDVFPATECLVIRDLITGAIEAGVVGHQVSVNGALVQLSSLLAPYRTREGGAAEREEAARRRVLDAGPERWNRA